MQFLHTWLGRATETGRRTRFDPTDLNSLKERPRRPRRVRSPRWLMRGSSFTFVLKYPLKVVSQAIER